MRRRIDPAIAWAFGCIVARAPGRQPLFEQLPVAGVPAAAAQGRVVSRRHRDRHDDRHPARADRPFGALGRRRRRDDGDGRHRLGARSAWRSRFRWASAAASRSGSSAASASAFLRIPSMVVTLAVNAVAQGLMVVHTGGFSPQDSSSPAMRFIATGAQRARHPQCAAGVGGGRRRRRLPADPDDVRPHGLRDRQPRARRLPLGCAHARSS